MRYQSRWHGHTRINLEKITTMKVTAPTTTMTERMTTMYLYKPLKRIFHYQCQTLQQHLTLPFGPSLSRTMSNPPYTTSTHLPHFIYCVCVQLSYACREFIIISLIINKATTTIQATHIFSHLLPLRFYCHSQVHSYF